MGRRPLDPLHDWRLTLVRWFKESPIWIPFFILVAFVVSPSSFSIVRGAAFSCLVLAYVAGIFSYLRWLKEAF